MPPFEHNVSCSPEKNLSGQRIRKLKSKDDCFNVHK